MRIKLFFQQGGDSYHGRVNRRASRYEQPDTRGQYPRPRNNAFADQPQRKPVRPKQATEAERITPAPDTAVYREGNAQYEQPAKPYVPGFMRGAHPQSQQGFAENQPNQPEQPVQQSEYIRQQNPYRVMSEKNKDPRSPLKQKTLIMLTALAVILFTGVLVMQLVFSAQTQAVYAARIAAEETIASRHPFGYRDLIEQEAYQNNLHPAFVAAIVLNESSFNPSAESYRGARGLMQMMPDTASWIFETIGGASQYSFDLMYDADLNVTYGCWYLSYLSQKFGGDPVLVAAAFHSGQTNVLNWLSNKAYSEDQKTIPLEKLPDGNTKEYVKKVLDAFAAYRRLYYDEVDA